MMEPPAPPLLIANAGASVIELDLVTLDASGSNPAAPNIPISSYLWEQTAGPEMNIINANTATAHFKAPFVSETLNLKFRLTVTGNNGATATSIFTVVILPSPKVDADEDGLIEIDTLTMLHNMRYNLAGTNYKTSETAEGLTSGCPSRVCTGYELTQNLNFDTDGDGSTYTGSITEGFTLDPGDNDNTYFNVAMGGWDPIGSQTAAFATTFEGNGYTIANLTVQRDRGTIGFFGTITAGSVIRNIGLVDNLVVMPSAASNNFGGGLVGYQAGGSIIASYTTGDIYTANNDDRIGALVGSQTNGTIIASYATGNASGNTAGQTVGGLVGDQVNGTIIASYATGNANGDGQHFTRVGALVGNQMNMGTVIASYATGSTDSVMSSSSSNFVGALVGRQEGVDASVSASYGFGRVGAGIETTAGDPGDLTAATLSATATSAGGAGTKWDDSESDTAGAWDFGTTSQAPVLRYADYDGPDGDVYSCDMFLAGKCGTIIPGQGR